MSGEIKNVQIYYARAHTHTSLSEKITQLAKSKF